MCIIGIDPSINSTGICIIRENQEPVYYIIASKMTKKMKNFQSNFIHYLPYDKKDTKCDSYSEKEMHKTYNIYKICEHIKNLIRIYRPEQVVMEGVSYGSTGSAALVDLSGLNFAIRMVLEDSLTPYIIASPTSVKKFAVSNGSATKEVMIDAWKRLDERVVDIKDIKVDDLADAYFMAHYKE